MERITETEIAREDRKTSTRMNQSYGYTGVTLTRSNSAYSWPSAEIEFYEESDLEPSKDYFETQNELAKNYLEMYEETLQHTQKERDVLKGCLDTYGLFVKNNEQALFNIILDYNSGTRDIKELGYDTIDQFRNLSYEEQKMIVGTKTEDGRQIMATIHQLEENIDRDFKTVSDADAMSYQQYEDYYQSLNQDISILKASKYSIEQQMKEYPYLQLSSTNEYLNYLSNHDSANVSLSVQSMMNNDSRYDYLTDDEKMMYHYLYTTGGKSKADGYLKAIEDRLNNKAGQAEAMKLISKVTDASGKLNPVLWNDMVSAGQGFLDGIENFGQGIMNIFSTDGMMSKNQYAQMYILDALSGELALSYQVGTTTGNMAPSMLASFLVSYFASPAAGAKVGSILMGSSAMGNAKNEALIRGNDLLSSTVYGTTIGLSETTLGYFLGAMPGLSKTAGFSLKNMFMEGLEEFSQEWFDAGMQSLVLQEEINWDEVLPQSRDSFLMGMLMAGLMNGGEAIINMTINSVNYSLQLSKVEEYMVAHPNASATDAVMYGCNVPLNESQIQLLDYAHLDSTQSTINVSILEDLLNNRDGLVEKFAHFQDNIDKFGHTQKDYLTALKQYVAEVTMHGDGLTDYMQSNLETIFGKNWTEASAEIDLLTQFGCEKFAVRQPDGTMADFDVDFLNQMLTNADLVDKFVLNFSANRDIFPNTANYYIDAVSQYVDALKRSGFTLSKTMKMNYTFLEWRRADSFQSLKSELGQKTYFEDPQAISLETLYNQLGSSTFYQDVIESDNNNPNLIDALEGYHQLYNEVMEQGIALDSERMYHLEQANNKYLEELNYQCDIFNQYSEFGINQHAVRTLALNPLQNYSLYDSLTKIVKNYFPFMSASKVATLLKSIDVKGVCTYATFLNELVVKYDGQEAKFKQDFGFDMYRIENGQKVLNSEQLLTDLYCFVNKKNTGVVTSKWLGYEVATDDFNQYGLSSGSGKRVDLIQDWLNSKGNGLTISSRMLFNSNYEQYDVESLQQSIARALANGETVAIDVFGKEKGVTEFSYYSFEHGVPSFADTDWGSHNGHSTLITGMTQDGYLIVSSWGTQRYIKISELMNAGQTNVIATSLK